MEKVELLCLAKGEEVIMTDLKEIVMDYCNECLKEHVKELVKTGKSGKYTLTEYVLDAEKASKAMKEYAKSKQN